MNSIALKYFFTNVKAEERERIERQANFLKLNKHENIIEYLEFITESKPPNLKEYYLLTRYYPVSFIVVLTK